MFDELRRVALFTSGVAELTRHQAERIVKDFVKTGDVRRQQATSAVKELIETSRVARTELVNLVRSEIQNQVAGLGLVTRRDIERLERRVTRLEGRSKQTTARKTSAKSTKASSSKKKTTQGTASGGRGKANPPSKRTP